MQRVDWRGQIIPKVAELLESYSYRPTLRQVYYRLVVALLIPNIEAMYKSLSRALVMAREDGVIPPLALEDRARTLHGGDWGFEGPDAFLRDALARLAEAPQNYTRPMWTSQQVVPLIWLEKDALLTPVAAVADRYRVRVHSARGYSSFTAVYQAAQDMQGTKPHRVLVLTDLDPSGEDMVRDLGQRLTRYGAGSFELEKIAVTQAQVAEFGLPPMPAKTSDPRFSAFARSKGAQAVELDALPPDVLERVITAAIEACIDAEPWNYEMDRIAQEREQVQRRVDAMVGYLRASGLVPE